MNSIEIIHVPRFNRHKGFLLTYKLSEFLREKKWTTVQTGNSMEHEAEAIVAMDGDKAVGYTAYNVYDWNSSYYIVGTFVLPDYRGKGIATRMFDLLKQRASENKIVRINSSAHHKNHEAQRLFEKQGRQKNSIDYTYYLEDWLKEAETSESPATEDKPMSIDALVEISYYVVKQPGDPIDDLSEEPMKNSLRLVFYGSDDSVVFCYSGNTFEIVNYKNKARHEWLEERSMKC